MPEILHKIRIDAPQNSVFDALTTLSGLSGWWTETVKGHSALDEVLSFYFDNGHTEMQFRVSQLDPPSRVAWRCIGGDAEWKGTSIVFMLSDENSQTVVHFAHQEWSQAGPLFMHCNTKWAYFLISLKHFVETGQGTPHPRDLKL